MEVEKNPDEDIIRLSTGRSVAPGHIERALGADGRVRHAVVCGADRPFVSVLIWAAESKDFERWTAHPEVGRGEHGHEGGEGGGEHGRERRGEHR